MVRHRVLQLLTFDALAGTEVMTYNLVKGLDRDRFDPHLAVLTGRGPLAGRYEAIGVPVHYLDAGRHPVRGVLGLFRLLARERFDLVHTYGLRPGVLLHLALRGINPRPVIVQGIRGMHIGVSDDPQSLRARASLRVERWLEHHTDYYAANSQGAIRFLREAGFPNEKLVCIPNGVDPAPWPDRLAFNGGLPEREPVVLCVARFVSVKRQEDVLRALAALAARGARFRAVFAGHGSTLPAMMQLSRELGLEDRVDFPGAVPRDRMPELYQRADVFVLASLSEGMPGSVMEAMAVGLPVVGTNISGTNELVVDGKTGYLLAVKNPEALAERIGHLLADPVQRRTMGEAGRRRIAEELSLETMVRRTEQLYLDALKRR